MKTRLTVTISLLATIFLLAACGTNDNINTVLPINSEPTETLDTNAIIDSVIAEVQAQLDQDAAAEQAAEQAAQAEENLSLTLDTPVPAVSIDLESQLINLYEQANPAAVYIIVPGAGSGSGFVYSADGYIVTNNHVVAGGNRFEVVFSSGERRAAQLTGTDADSDLAVIKVDNLPAGVQPLPLADSNNLRVGQFVVAIGNPFGEQGSMSMGIVSGLGRSLASQRTIPGNNSYSLPQVIQTDAPINPGNSGGPLLNLNGEVVGVNSAIISASGTNSGVGFSIPVNAVRQIAPSLIANGSYTYPYMGAGFDEEVSLDEQQLYRVPQTQGAYVLNVTPGTPAAAAGLIPADPNTAAGGDLIIAIDGQPINTFGDLNGYLVFNTTVGQTIEITVLRNGTTTTIPLTLGARP